MIALRIERDDAACPVGERIVQCDGCCVTCSVADLRLDELRQQRVRLLPSEMAGFDRNDLGDSFLHDVELRACERRL